MLIDNFAYTKKTLEKATKDFADFLMAIVPNQITYTKSINNFDGQKNIGHFLNALCFDFYISSLLFTKAPAIAFSIET